MGGMKYRERGKGLIVCMMIEVFEIRPFGGGLEVYRKGGVTGLVFN